MLPSIVGLTLLVVQAGAYADSATAELVALARVRHAEQDTLVNNYHATVTTRIDLSYGRSRFARMSQLGVVEYVTTVDWVYPGDLRIEYVALRKKLAFEMLPGPVPAFDIDQDDVDDPRIDEPWFISGSLGDEVEVFCCDFQARPAIHPLADGAARFYRYAIADSFSLRVEALTLDVVALNVTPTQDGPELMIGTLWIDRDAGHVVRLAFRLVGDRLFARGRNDILNKVFRLDAEIEYGLYEGTVWLPRRQFMVLEARDPWVTGVVMPLRIDTQFEDYVINERVSTAVADDWNPLVGWDTDMEGQSFTRHGSGHLGSSRWEIVSPSMDSLLAYDAWVKPLQFQRDHDAEGKLRKLTTDLQRAAASLDPEVLPSLSSSVAAADGGGVTRVGEVFRYNRIQGVALGIPYIQRFTDPAVTLKLLARYGFRDKRVVGSATLARETAGGGYSVSALHNLQDIDPFSQGLSFGNSMNALITGHDDANYLLASGGQVQVRVAQAAAIEWSFTLGAEHHTSVGECSAVDEARDFVFDPGLCSNPPVREGWWGAFRSTVDGRSDALYWRLGVDALGDDALLGVRGWGRAGYRWGPIALRASSAIASRTDVPQLLAFVGGPETVRGYDFGARAGQAMWALQVEGRLPAVRGIRPHLLADAGNAGDVGRLLKGEVLAGVGVGLSVSVLIAELRGELSWRVGAASNATPRVDIRFISGL